MPFQITTGVSSGLTLNWRSSDSAIGSFSTSIQSWGRRLRSANCRNRLVSGEKWEPMILSPAPSSTRCERRSRNARRRKSLKPGSSVRIVRRSSAGMASTLPLPHDGGEVGDFLGQQVELADDLARLAHANDPRGDERRLDELDLPFENDVEVAGQLSLMEEHLTIVGLLDLAILAKHGDLIVSQFPERVDLFVRAVHGCHGLLPSGEGESLRSGGEGARRTIASSLSSFYTSRVRVADAAT